MPVRHVMPSPGKINSRFNDKLVRTVDYNHVSDDYYLRDLSNNLMKSPKINYYSKLSCIIKSDLKFLGGCKAFQTLHPIEENVFANKYMRLPQLALAGDHASGL